MAYGSPLSMSKLIACIDANCASSKQQGVSGTSTAAPSSATEGPCQSIPWSSAFYIIKQR